MRHWKCVVLDKLKWETTELIPLEFFHSALGMLSNAKSILVFIFFNVLQISSTSLNPGDEMCICCGDGSQFWQAGQFPAVGLSTVTQGQIWEMPLPIRYHYAMLREMTEDTLKLQKEKKGLLFLSLSISAAFEVIRHFFLLCQYRSLGIWEFI